MDFLNDINDSSRQMHQDILKPLIQQYLDVREKTHPV